MVGWPQTAALLGAACALGACNLLYGSGGGDSGEEGFWNKHPYRKRLLPTFDPPDEGLVILLDIQDDDLAAFAAPDGGNIAAYNSVDPGRRRMEIEHYRDGHLIAWVELKGAASELWLGFGGGDRTQATQGLWEDYAFVWHAADLETSGDSPVIGTPMAVSTEAFEQGGIGPSFDFREDGDGIDFGVLPAIDFGIDDGFTVSFWAQSAPGSSGNYQIPLYKGARQPGEPGYAVSGNDVGEEMTFDIASASTDDPKVGSDHVALLDGQWCQIVGVIRRGANQSLEIYRDGARVGGLSSVAGIDPMGGERLVIGNSVSGDSHFLGAIDEVRIAPRAQSAALIRLEYQSQSGELSFEAEPMETFGD